MIEDGYLAIGPDCPYWNPDVPNDFQLALEEDDLGDPIQELAGFYFNGELYRQEKRCEGDVNEDGVVNGIDLAAVIGYWGLTNPDADLDDDGTVGGTDLTILLARWGACTGQRSAREAGSRARDEGYSTLVHRGRPTSRQTLGMLVGCACQPLKGASGTDCTHHTRFMFPREESGPPPRGP